GRRRRLPRRRLRRDAAAGEELLSRGAAVLDGDGDPHRLAARRGPRPDPRERARPQRRDLPEGAGEAARQPDLARWRGLPARLADRALAGRPREAPARGALRGRRCARAHVTTAAIALGALLAVAAVLLVARPFLREPAPA